MKEDNSKKTFLGMNPIKVVFAMEYILQGLGNPFQGITYQPFFRHFTVDYGLNEAATQELFSKSYLAWSFKPILGFLIDAYGKTKIILTMLLGSAVCFYFLAPVVDVSVSVFFWYMFVLSIFLAATDVAVDRATVVEGEDEAKESGKSKATTVGLNQAICWAAIYGTSIFSAIAGGWIADNAPFNYLMIGLGVVPLLVLFVVRKLPDDTAPTIPLKESVMNFWTGLNTGPLMWIILFYFLFHFQPLMGAIWNNYLIETLKFSQTQIGFADASAYVGYFFGVLLFAKWGVVWQERIGLRRIFQMFILLSIFLTLTQTILVDPIFSRITDKIGTVIPLPRMQVRLGFMAFYNVILYFFLGFTRMSTFSLVGAVIPAKAAGSLFAGFMSVANLAYSFSYSTGSWFYTHGLEYSLVRFLQVGVFGIPAKVGDNMAIGMLILIGATAYLLSFLAVHVLPDQRETMISGDWADTMPSPERYKELGAGFLSAINKGTFALFGVLLGTLTYFAGMGIIKSVLVAFFLVAFARKMFLDWRYDAHTGAGD
ncbi:MAG: hypothetical protein ABIJ96_11950 [Elusimicrobiota bacterium]